MKCEVGCKIPADMRMIEILSDHLRVDQAILTGTLVPIDDNFLQFSLQINES